MKIGIMIMDEQGEFIGIARDTFNPAQGYSSEALHELYRKALNRLLDKLKKHKEQKDEKMD
jgi:hypothetical protein